MTETAIAPGALRPPKTGRLWILSPSGPMDRGLVEVLTRAVAHALEQRGRAARDPEKAIHEYRKAVRRARAVVKLVRDVLGERAFRPLDQALREAVLATSGLRDVDVLRQLVSKLADASANMDERHLLHLLDRALLARQAAQREGSVDEALSRGAELLVLVPARFARELPSLSLVDVRTGFAGSFARARRARKMARRDPTDEAVHGWRKRVKELRYQLELDPTSDDDPTREVWSDLAESLGEITDRAVLRRTVRELCREAAQGRGEHAGHAPEEHPAVEQLLGWLDAGIAAAIEAALEGSHAAFASHPADFAAGLFAGG